MVHINIFATNLYLPVTNSFPDSGNSSFDHMEGLTGISQN